MQAVIQKLELKKIINRHYIKIELIDEFGAKHTIDNPFLSDDINFRRIVFGLLTACGTHDLMRLATSNPETRKMVGYYQNGLQILENENMEWFSLNRKTGLYTCKKPNKKTHQILEELAKRNDLDISTEEGIIEKITSESGTFVMEFSTKAYSTYFVTGQIYYGFGYPISIGRNADPTNTALSAKLFTSFIESLMKFYGINDLLQFGGKTDNLPIVEIALNKDNKINSITNPTTGIGIKIGNEYEIINNSKPEERKDKELKKESQQS